MSICTASYGQQEVTEHTRSGISGKKKQKKQKNVSSRATFPISMLSNFSSRWGLSDHTMHGRRLVFVFQGEKQKPLLLTCMTHTGVTEEASTHCHRRKVCPSPPALQLQPPFSSCHSCHCDPKESSFFIKF